MRQDKPLSESGIVTAIFFATVVVFIFRIARRILHLIQMIDFYNNNKPDPFREPVDKKRTKKLQEIVGRDDEPVVHFLTGDTILNAFSDGSKHIYYSVPLEKMCTEDELIAVLLHEYGHYKEKHNIHRYKTYLFEELMFHSCMVGISLAVGIPIFRLVIFLMQLVLTDSQLDHYYRKDFSHKHEYMADSYATKYGYGKDLISLFKKLEALEKKEICKLLSVSQCEAKLEELNKDAEHPTYQDRIKKILADVTPKFISGKTTDDQKRFSKLVEKLSSDFHNKTLPKLEKKNGRLS